MYEVRWIVRPGWDGPERVLQHRYKLVSISDYISPNEQVSTYGWGEWQDVPTYDTTKDSKDAKRV